MLYTKRIQRLAVVLIAVLISESCLLLEGHAAEGDSIPTTVTAGAETSTPAAVNAIDVSLIPVAKNKGNPDKIVAGYSMDPYSYFSEKEWKQRADIYTSWKYGNSEIKRLLDEEPCHFSYESTFEHNFSYKAFRKNGKRIKQPKKNQGSYDYVMKYGLEKGDYVIVDGKASIKNDAYYLIAITQEEFEALRTDFINTYIEEYGDNPMEKMQENDYDAYLESLDSVYGYDWDFGKIAIYADGEQDFSATWKTVDEHNGKHAEKIYYYKTLHVEQVIKKSQKPEDPRFKKMKYGHPKTSKWLKEEVILNKDGVYRAKFTVKNPYSKRVWGYDAHDSYTVHTGCGVNINMNYDGEAVGGWGYILFYFKPNLTKWEKKHVNRKSNYHVSIVSEYIPKKIQKKVENPKVDL